MTSQRKTIWVWANTVATRPCRGETCGATITWAEACRSGKRLCFDGELVAIRTEYLAVDGVTPRSPARGGRLAWEVDQADTHWASCPDAATFRRPRAGASR